MQDDYKNYQNIDRNLTNIGMSDPDRQAVYTTIASVLHLGNIEFEDDPDDNRGGSRITEKAEKSLQITAALMGLDSDELRWALYAICTYNTWRWLPKLSKLSNKNYQTFP